MGVKYLNTLIKKKASNALKYVKLSKYAGKVIAIDTSIYMHKYLASNSLMESMYFMMSQFKYLNVRPIFVFDGCAPEEKRETLNAREAVRQNAMQRYNELQYELLDERHQAQTRPDEEADEGSSTSVMNQELVQRKMQSLKRRFLRVTSSEVNDLKRLMREYGIQYIECDTESDVMCAYLVKSGIAHACMSDDMDMFLYGCPVVLRDVNIWHGSGVEYTMSAVLDGLGISMRGFRMACVLSGTDYTYKYGCCNHEEERVGVKFYLSNLVKEYSEFERKPRNSDKDEHGYEDENAFDIEFYEWVVDAHKKQVSTTKTIPLFEKAYSIFSSAPSAETQEYIRTHLNINASDANDVNIYETPPKVKRIMAKYNFIYIT
jgi:5'-3' exonuclease